MAIDSNTFIPSSESVIEAREMEIELYTININVYTNLLSKLDGNWDEDLIHLKDLENQEAARQCPMNRLERLAELQQYEQVNGLLKTEIVERAKSIAILEVLKSA